MCRAHACQVEGEPAKTEDSVCQYCGEKADKEAGARQEMMMDENAWAGWSEGHMLVLGPASVEPQILIPFTELDLMSSSGSGAFRLLTTVCLHCCLPLLQPWSLPPSSPCKTLRQKVIFIPRLPLVEGRWVSLVKQMRVNQVAAREAPASISTRISFSIPRMESANLQHNSSKG